MILKNSAWEEKNNGLYFSESWEKSKEVEVIFVGGKKWKKKVKSKIPLLKIGDTERKGCIVATYQMKIGIKIFVSYELWITLLWIVSISMAMLITKWINKIIISLLN